MKNGKTKFIGVNLLLSAPVSGALFLFLSAYHSNVESAFLALIYYVVDVLNQSNTDYLESEIDKLKEKQN